MKFPNMPNVMGLVNVGKTFLMAHRPEMLLGASIVSTIGTGVLSARGGYKSGQQVYEAEFPSVDFTDPENPLSRNEKVQLTWLNYLPAVGAGLTSIGATSALHMVHVKDKKALASMAVAAFDELKQEILDLDSEKEAILEANADPKTGAVKHVDQDGVIEELYLVRDMHTGRDFWLNEARVKAGVNEVNRLMSASDRGNGSGCVDLNTFYMWAGVPEIPRGEEYGWSGVNVGLEWDDDHREDGRPIRTFRFQPEPAKGYDSGA